MSEEITVNINIGEKIDKLQECLNTMKEDYRKHASEDEARFHELKVSCVKREDLEKYYTKGEMDNAIRAIQEYTGSVKELLTTHLSFVNKNIDEIKKEHDELRKDASSSKDKSSSTVTTVLIGLVMFVLGAGMNLIIHLFGKIGN
jgi:hypothetical protein